MFACYTFFCKKVTSQKIILSHFLFELFIVKRAPFTVHIFFITTESFQESDEAMLCIRDGSGNTNVYMAIEGIFHSIVQIALRGTLSVICGNTCNVSS